MSTWFRQVVTGIQKDAQWIAGLSQGDKQDETNGIPPNEDKETNKKIAVDGRGEFDEDYIEVDLGHLREETKQIITSMKSWIGGSYDKKNKKVAEKDNFFSGLSTSSLDTSRVSDETTRKADNVINDSGLTADEKFSTLRSLVSDLAAQNAKLRRLVLHQQNRILELEHQEESVNLADVSSPDVKKDDIKRGVSQPFVESKCSTSAVNINDKKKENFQDVAEDVLNSGLTVLGKNYKCSSNVDSYTTKEEIVIPKDMNDELEEDWASFH